MTLRLLDPASIIVTTARQLMAGHSRMDGDRARGGRCMRPWPGPTAAHAGAVCRAAGVAVPHSLDAALGLVDRFAVVAEGTQQLAVLAVLPRRRPGCALSAVVEAWVGEPR